VCPTVRQYLVGQRNRALSEAKEGTHMSQSAFGQKQVTILLAVAAVLLAAVIGIIVWQNSGSLRPPTPRPTRRSAQH
jgi:cytochrome b subunit of formate dehydrogenase